jgi:serine/threonine protein kinase
LAIKLLQKTGKFVKAVADTQREISILKYLKGHPNILGLIAGRGTHFNTQLIMPLYDQDLRKFSETQWSER